MNKYLMNTFSKRRGTALVASLSVLLLAGCIQPADIEEVNKGEVSFGVSASYQSDVMTRSADDEIQTRTVYSGKDENNEDVKATSVTERIDWLSSDDITILCQQAEGNKTANFSITPTGYTDGTAISNATIDPIDHKLYWSSVGVHHFFGLYPSPLMDGAPSGVDIATSGSDGTAATITGTIPATQTVTVSGTELKPDMAYAYMYAATQASAGDVHLRFKPLVTTLRFTLKSQTSFPSGLTLTKIELTSTQTNGSYLAGDFTATITDDGYNPATGLSVANNANRTNAITINVPNGVQLGSTPLMFTILTLPMDQTAMKVKLSFSDNSSKTLSLRSGGSDITVHATKKCYIQDANLPWVYELDAATSLSVPYTGGSGDYTVTSYKHISNDGNNSGKVPVTWTAVAYSMDNTNWTSTRPGALADFTDNGPGSGSATAYNATIGHSPRTGTAIDALTNATEQGTQSSPYDLSTHNITGGSINKTTANCYVVSAAGWYKFPLAYGNAYKNGSTNSIAYQTGNTSSYALRNLVKHDGNAISSPDVAGVSSVELLWQDSENLLTVSDISISNGYVVFHVEKDTICEGNAVIAAKNSDGTILWSWHVWVTPYTGNVTMRGKTFQERNLGWCDGGEISWPARNIWVRFQQAESGKTAVIKFVQRKGYSKVVQGSGPHYQWGRKDPLIPPSGETGTDIDQTYKANKVWFNAAGVASQDVPISNGRPQTIGYAIQHPMEMIWLDRVHLPGYRARAAGTQADPHEYGIFDGRGWAFSDWIGSDNLYYGTGHYSNLWNYNIGVAHDVNDMLTVKTFENATHAKTVYDPCPIGYTIPLPTELSNLAKLDTQMGGYPNYSGSQNITWSDSQHGFVCNNNLLPANGMRFYLMNNPHVGNVGKYGYYFSSAYCNAHNGLVLELGYYHSSDDPNPYIQMSSAYAKGSGRSIRCVPE